MENNNNNTDKHFDHMQARARLNESYDDPYDLGETNQDNTHFDHMQARARLNESYDDPYDLGETNQDNTDKINNESCPDAYKYEGQIPAEYEKMLSKFNPPEEEDMKKLSEHKDSDQKPKGIVSKPNKEQDNEKCCSIF